MITEQCRTLIALSYLKGVGSKSLLNLITNYQLLDIDLLELFKLTHKQFQSRHDDIKNVFKKADEQIHIAQEKNHSIICYADPEYPEYLKAVEDSPIFLFCAGNISLLKSPSVSIIGTREPTEHGLHIAEQVTKWSVKNNWTVTSGLAKGIDTQAHSKCIENLGHTIAVLAHGLEKIYPAENKELASKIIENNGLLISEYKYNSFVAKSNFINRDRIQAALSRAVILIQSGVTGGSLHASRSALKYNRYLVVTGQSKTDEANNIENIQANSILIKGSNIDKAQLLKVKETKLKNLIILYHSGFYESVSVQIENFYLNKTRATIDKLI